MDSVADRTAVVPAFGRTLDRLAAAAAHVEGVWERDLCGGDWVIVSTRNSTYTLGVVGDGTYAVTGGWFSAMGADGSPVGVTGCTWGGCAILTGLVAAPGMHLEFGNGVRTTRIREVRTIRGQAGRRPH
jgi:hypothetical protein